MAFADRLRDLREARGVSRQQLADVSGISRGAIRNYEQALREPTFDTVCKMADALGVSLEEFRDVAPVKAKGRKAK